MLRTDDEILETAAQGGGLESKLWPALLERLLPRLDHIVHDEFPTPIVQPPLSPPPPPPAEDAADDDGAGPPTLPGEGSSSQGSSQTSQANKENAPPPAPASTSSASRPAVPPFSPSDTSAPAEPSLSNGSLPPPLSSMLSSVHSTLTTTFADSPPYTIQRLAELILRPRVHYRALGPYLRALDRVVSVSSDADRFPLPAIAMPGASNDVGLLNGAAGGSIAGGTNAVGGALGSDESLGGALLTPIPWLRNDPPGEVRTESTEIVDGPNGAGSVETVSVSVHGVPSTSPQSQANDTLRESGAVTQGELLRQEQQAGVVPVAQAHFGRQTRSSTSNNAGGASGSARATSPDENEEAERKMEDEDRPHARGPDLVGVEDMGPQDRETGSKGSGFDVEAALGRTNHKDEKEGLSTEQAKDVEEMSGVEKEGPAAPATAESEDTVLVDVDGKTESDEDQKADASRENEGPDAVDSTTL